MNVIKLRHAFEWLRKYNPYYRDVEWREDWAQEWLQEDVDVGATREEDFADGHEVSLSKEAFEIWMQLVLENRESGDDGSAQGGASGYSHLVNGKADCRYLPHANGDDGSV